jgi:hypothetical protein
MIDPNHCSSIVEDSRDDNGTAGDARIGQSLCDVDDDESAASLATISSWLSVSFICGQLGDGLFVMHM